MELVRLIVGSVFLLAGLFIFVVQLFGIFRFNYALNRMHAAAMGDTLGLASALIGLMIFQGFDFTTLKIALVIIFLWCASPVSSHLLARLEVMTNSQIEHHATVYENLKDLESELAAEDAAAADKEAEQ